jgi:hypothetical protein
VVTVENDQEKDRNRIVEEEFIRETRFVLRSSRRPCLRPTAQAGIEAWEDEEIEQHSQ